MKCYCMNQTGKRPWCGQNCAIEMWHAVSTSKFGIVLYQLNALWLKNCTITIGCVMQFLESRWQMSLAPVGPIKSAIICISAKKCKAIIAKETPYQGSIIIRCKNNCITPIYLYSLLKPANWAPNFRIYDQCGHGFVQIISQWWTAIAEIYATIVRSFSETSMECITYCGGQSWINFDTNF